jgi:hypothetical protein
MAHKKRAGVSSPTTSGVDVSDPFEGSMRRLG